MATGQFTLRGSKQPVRLSQNDFVSAGGEGEVYRIGDDGYKLYHDPTKMMPIGKITDLSALDDPDFLRPLDVLIDRSGNPVGYKMRFVDNVYQLVQLFTQAFRTREGFTNDYALELVKRFQGKVEYAHTKSIYLVDINELNFLVPKTFDGIFCIDTDSYRTPNYRPTAIMDGVRDFTTNDFNELTDWYSFGCMALQILVGIHPYQGTHKAIKGWEGRCKSHTSVFSPDVVVPRSCLPFDIIPTEYRQWFYDVYQLGERKAPPATTGLVATAILTPAPVKVGTNIVIEDMGIFDGGVIQVNGDHILTAYGIYRHGRRVYTVGSPGLLYISPTQQAYHCVLNANRVTVTKLVTGESKELTMNVDEIAIGTKDIMVKAGNHIHNIVVSESGPGWILSTRRVANCSANAGKLYDGCLVQRLMGSAFISAIVGDACYEHRTPELDEYRVIGAKRSRNVIGVTAEKDGAYASFQFVFNKDFTQYSVFKREDVYPYAPNFVTLDTDICVTMQDDGELMAFHAKLPLGKTMSISDPSLHAGCELFTNDSAILCSNDGRFSKLSMKR